jgi:phosphohistidine phosphatase
LLTSPLLRARQTAEIFQSEHLSSCLEISATLAPWGDFGDWLTWLEQWRQAERTSLGLVGHQPDLGEWAEILVWGEAKGGLALKKTGMLGITLPEAGSPIGNSLLFWLTQPRLLL